MMKRKLILWMAAVALLAIGAVGTARADVVLYDFEGGTDLWWRFGGGTLDFGADPGNGSVGDGIYYVTSLDETLWGGAVRSPDLGDAGYDMSMFTGFRADVQLSVDGLDPAYPGPGPQVELMFQLPGYYEWAAHVDLPLDGTWHTISANFADLIPQNVATDPITPAELARPDLEIRVLLRNLNRDPGAVAGKVRMRVDEVAAFPEPASLSLLALGGAVLVRRRRS